MRPEEPEDEAWKRLSRAFFPAPPSPTAEQTEAFVDRLLARLPEEDPVPAPLRWLDRPWLVPALGLALASLLVGIGGLPPEPIAPSDAWMLATPSGPDAARLDWLASAAPLDGEP